MVGLFINTLPVRIKTEPGEIFETLLQKAQVRLAQSTFYEYVPLADIQAGTPQKSNLLDHILVFENYPVDDEIKKMSRWNGTGFSVNRVEIFEQTSYDLNIIVLPQKQLTIKIQYNSRVYESRLIQRIEEHLVRMLQQVTADPGIPLSQLEIISESEKKRLLYDYNQITRRYPDNKAIHQLIEEQASRTPDNVAVTGADGGRAVTYRELSERTDHLAGVLREKGLIPGNIAAIMVERSIEMVFAVVGVLKSGAAYLPLDKDYPVERKQYILEDSQASLLISREAPAEPLNWTGKTVDVDIINDLRAPGTGPAFPGVPVASSDFAYVIYTSGSTGRPKGVLVRHRGLVNYITWAAGTYVGNEKAAFPLYTSISFDLTVTSIFTPMVTGNTIVVYGEEKQYSIIEKVIDDNGAEVVKLTPSHLRLLCNKKIDSDALTLKRFIVGGEDLDARLAGEYS